MYLLKNCYIWSRFLLLTIFPVPSPAPHTNSSLARKDNSEPSRNVWLPTRHVQICMYVYRQCRFLLADEAMPAGLNWEIGKYTSLHSNATLCRSVLKCLLAYKCYIHWSCEPFKCRYDGKYTVYSQMQLVLFKFSMLCFTNLNRN